MTAAPPSSSPPPRRRRLLLGCGLLLMIAVALVTIVSLIGYSLYRTVPADYVRVQDERQRSNPDDRYASAIQLENHMSSELTFTSYFDEHGRPIPDASDTRHILVPTDQINAWLDQRLQQWLDNRDIRLPIDVSDPAFWTAGDKVMLAARVRAADFDHVVSCAIRIDMPEDSDEATIRLTGLRIGRLPVPLGVIRDAVGDDHATQAIDGITFPAVQVIGGQTARWVSITPVDGGLMIELRRESSDYNASP